MIKPFRSAAVLALFAVSAGAQQVIVTPTNPQGWGLDPVRAPLNGGVQAITGTQPRSGNGSLQMSIFNDGSQHTGFALFAPAGQSFGTLSSLSSLGFDWFAQSPVVQSPTLRLYVSMDNGSGGTQLAQFGWYADNVVNGPVPADTWTSTDLYDADGNNNFFMRLFGSGGNPTGQLPTTCSNAGRTNGFDDRMQSLGSWISACDGLGGNANLAGATVIGIGVDIGSYPGSGTTQDVDYADNVSIGFGRNGATTYNFEVTSTPEPSSMVLLGTGILGLVGVARVRRRRA